MCPGNNWWKFANEGAGRSMGREYWMGWPEGYFRRWRREKEAMWWIRKWESDGGRLDLMVGEGEGGDNLRLDWLGG